MLKQQRRELAHAAVAVIEKRKIVKFLWLGKGLRLGDGRFKLGPWQYGFDGGERIAAPGTRLDQSLTDLNVQPDLFVDRFSAGVKLLGRRVQGPGASTATGSHWPRTHVGRAIQRRRRVALRAHVERDRHRERRIRRSEESRGGEEG